MELVTFFFPVKWREYSGQSEIRFCLSTDFLNILLIIPLLWSHGTAIFLSSVSLWPRRPILGATGRALPAGQGGDPAPGIFDPASGFPWSPWSRVFQRWWMGYEERLWELGVCSQERRWVREDLIPVCQGVQGAQGAICIWVSNPWLKKT